MHPYIRTFAILCHRYDSEAESDKGRCYLTINFHHHHKLIQLHDGFHQPLGVSRLRSTNIHIFASNCVSRLYVGHI